VNIPPGGAVTSRLRGAHIDLVESDRATTSRSRALSNLHAERMALLARSKAASDFVEANEARQPRLMEVSSPKAWSSRSPSSRRVRPSPRSSRPPTHLRESAAPQLRPARLHGRQQVLSLSPTLELRLVKAVIQRVADFRG